jgi:nucleotide-binding universal stress UspA family protein
MFKRIVVPLDGSPLAEAVLPHVRQLASTQDTEIILLRVPVYVVFDPAMVTPSMVSAMYDYVRSDADRYLKETVDSLKKDGFNARGELCEGPVAEAVLDCVQRMHADLIAMSTHGRSGVARFLIGSVADKIVRTAPIPVLLVRPENMKPAKP